MNILENTFGRVAIPLMTPFTQSDEVDSKRACQLAERMIERNHCSSLIVAGMNEEFHALAPSERIQLFQEIKRTIGNKVPLIAGAGATRTDETLYFTEQAEDLGYDAALILPPDYGIPTQNDLIEHFTTIAAKTALPIVLHIIPIFTNANIEPEIALELAEIESIVGIKEETALMPLQTSEILVGLPEDTDFSLYCGDDTMVLAVLVQGRYSAISGGAHVTGDLLMAMIKSFFCKPD